MKLEAIQSLRQAIQAQASESKAAWFANYIKHDTKYYGLGLPLVKQITKTWALEQGFTAKTMFEQKALVQALFADEFTELKLAGILCMEQYWAKAPILDVLACCEFLFEQAYIYDWSVCDWLAVRCLGPWFRQHPALFFERLGIWNQVKNLWQARAALIAYLGLKPLAPHRAFWEPKCLRLIQREERFAKTAVGWFLRVYSKEDPAYVDAFLEQHQAFVTPELRRNALKYKKLDATNKPPIRGK